MGVLVAGAVVAGCVRRHWADVLVAVAVIVVSTPLARWLRLTLFRPDHGYSYVENTLPSTHVAWVTACVVAVLLLWPGRRSPGLVLAGALVVWLACIGNVVGYAHRPSDAVASVVLVLVVTAASMDLRHRSARARGIRGGRD